MAGNDPFAEPADDGERTVIRPNPGGRRTGTASPPAQNPFGGGAQPEAGGYGGPAGYGGQGQSGQGADAFGVPQRAPAASAAAAQGGPGQVTMTGMNTLIACGSPLFALISRIRNRAQHVDPDKLRQSVVGEIRGFESRALSAGIDPQQVKVARYALCATLDDVILNTPWGSQSNWSLQSMVGTFHRETVGGDRFYDLLARLEKDPAANIDLLEFLYMCLSMGFEGRLRVEDRGSDKHLTIRNGLARIIRAQRGTPEHDLSPHWKGLTKPHKHRSLWKPVWIAVAACFVLMAGIFSTMSVLLSRDTGPLIGRVQGLTPTRPATLLRQAPPPSAPPPVEAATVEAPGEQALSVREFLSDEIAAKKVEVQESATELEVRLVGQGLFRSGSDELEAGLDAVVSKIGEALAQTRGPIIVAGYTDNIPSSGRGRFKDNKSLSLARAQQVAKILAQSLGGFDRLQAEGRGDADPIADNATPEGRAQNRRVEVILVKQEGS